MLPNFLAASGLLITEDKFLYNCCTFLSNLTASCLLCNEALKLLPSRVRCLLSLTRGRLKDQFGAWRFLICSLKVLSCHVKKLERPHRGRDTSEIETEHGEIRPSWGDRKMGMAILNPVAQITEVWGTQFVTAGSRGRHPGWALSDQPRESRASQNCLNHQVWGWDTMQWWKIEIGKPP